MQRGGRLVAAPTGVVPLRPLFLQHFTLPRRPHQSRPQGEPASPKGSFCSVSDGNLFILTSFYPEGSRYGTQAVPYGFAGWWFRLTAQVLFVTLLGGAPRSESKSTDCRGQSHHDFTDESSPLHCVVPFNRTGSIRNVAGGRLPPLQAWYRSTTTGCIRNVAWCCSAQRIRIFRNKSKKK